MKVSYDHVKTGLATCWLLVAVCMNTLVGVMGMVLLLTNPPAGAAGQVTPPNDPSVLGIQDTRFTLRNSQ